MGRRRRRGRPINGWLIVDKTEGMTSTHVVNVVKAMTRADKVGHGGTLDPLATGVLPIAMGHATKTVSYVMDAPKRYRFTMRLGEARDTDDAEGQVTARSDRRPTDAEIEALLDDHIGDIMQTPPAFAAVKVQGERAYDIARRGESVELEPRTVHIETFELVERPDEDHAVFEVTCGKGTYVRALARDIGRELGCLAHVSALRRLAVGAFDETGAITLDTLRRITDDDALPQVLVPVTTALADIPAFAVTGPQADRLRAGQSIVVVPRLVQGLDEGEAVDGCTIKAVQDGDVIALTRLEGGELAPLRVFNP
ncbi:MAG: tRNA pseudouridine(55) synthase TruB [Geminicoccaceae bacterium]|nr:tRNA pseudouridine(55) synthase TruB [Geminicoccaceae bacterium]